MADAKAKMFSWMRRCFDALRPWTGFLPDPLTHGLFTVVQAGTVGEPEHGRMSSFCRAVMLLRLYMSSLGKAKVTLDQQYLVRGNSKTLKGVKEAARDVAKPLAA
ncbi:hypothetical protein OPT61_g5239 [Boeremia exigua]|uniref:Uncharacterized protein n=1 Tax=Boeremia exigua TaxID=749465 RepID=A0ACC2IB89_9PLEO|nr:hypothetical protein OPT61_g5239 [Boeremia exigua]